MNIGLPATTPANCFDAWELRGGQPLPRSFARALLKLPHEETLDNWLDRLEGAANRRAAGRTLAAELLRRIEPEPTSGADAGAMCAEVMPLCPRH